MDKWSLSKVPRQGGGVNKLNLSKTPRQGGGEQIEFVQDALARGG
jgi:hypothetical protein